ncbi:MAG: hypothetical protein M1533_05195 [Candidatus Thermoplasmatota archaeon]|jgi:predicted permease|nr:hypothetical protein [Candidatus Thermoplasmatota archaeon]
MNYTYKIARQIMIEQKYQAIKNFGYFIKKQKKIRSLQRMILTNYWVGSVSFAFISIILVLARLTGGYSLIAMANIGLVIFVYGFLVSLYNSLFLFQGISRNNLLEPIWQLPAERNRNIYLVCFLIFYGSSVAFMTGPDLIIFYILSGNYASLFFGLVWTLIVILSGFCLGTLISMISLLQQRRRGRLEAAISRGVKFGGIALSLLLFEVVIYIPETVPTFIPELSGVWRYAVFMLNIPYSVFLAGGNAASLAENILFSAIFFLAFFYLSVRLGQKSMSLIERYPERIPLNYSTQRRKTSSPGLAMLTKDLRLIFRDPQNVSLVVIPVIITLPLILSLFNPVAARTVTPEGIFVLLLSLAAFSASFYTIMALNSESTGFSVIRMLPITRYGFVTWKSISILMIFMFIVVPSVAIAVLITGFSPLYIPLISAALIGGFVAASAFNGHRLVGKIGRETDNINMESFGGNLGLLKVFATTLLLLLLPVVAIDLLQTYSIIAFSGYYEPISLYALAYLGMILIPYYLRREENESAAASAF